MKTLLKNILLMFTIIVPIMLSYVDSTNVGRAPEFDNDFLNYFKSSDSEENVAVIPWVSYNNSIAHNIRCIFYPNNNVIWLDCGAGATYWWSLWNIMKYLWYTLLVLFIVIAGIRLLINWANAEKVKSALSSLLYIIIGALLFFWAIRILWSVLQIWTINWTEGLKEKIDWDQGSLFFFVLSFAKAMAFLAAILMIIVHWFKMMASADKSDKVKIWLKWLLNVIIALVIIKLIDYIYYVAQLPDLITEATTLIIEIAKVLWFIIWALMVIMLFYAGFLFITDQWSSEKMKKATNIIVGILVTALVIFSLLLIIYEIFNEFVE